MKDADFGILEEFVLIRDSADSSVAFALNKDVATVRETSSRVKNVNVKKQYFGVRVCACYLVTLGLK